MKTVFNSIIPFKGYKAMTVWPFIFVREECRDRYDATTQRHEAIHGEQQLEVGVIGIELAVAFLLAGYGWWSLLPVPLFFWWYLLEWIVKIPVHGFRLHEAYRAISFEREAYGHQDEKEYITGRKHYAWLRYLYTKNKK